MDQKLQRALAEEWGRRKLELLVRELEEASAAVRAKLEMKYDPPKPGSENQPPYLLVSDSGDD